MKIVKFQILFFFVLILWGSNACQNQQSKALSELGSIDLLRGDVLLCGDPEFGEISFFVSCKNASRSTFNLAVSLLHSFEYAEAEKTFAKVIDADPECAMAYWGVAMSLYHSLWFAPSDVDLEKGSRILAIANSIATTKREQEYLDAIGAYYQDWKEVEHKVRAKRYEAKMKDIYLKYQDDPEAAIFYALALRSTADPKDKKYNSQKKAGEILEGIFPDQPNHPGVAHYIIHNYDYPELADMALTTARRYAEIAPASAHAQHMPSHIFTRLGLWDESIATNINSASSAVCYAEAVEMGGNWEQEIHAIDYLVYAYLQKGDNANALEQYAYLKSMSQVTPLTTAVAYPFAAIPARIALENRDWGNAAQLELPKLEIPWEKHPWEKAIFHFARALGSARSGDLTNAKSELTTLYSLHEDLVNMSDEYRSNQVLIQIKTVEAWINFAKGEFAQSISLMTEAADLEDQSGKHPVTPCEVLPARELLGDLLLALNQPAEALESYKIDLVGHPNRLNGIYGAAIAAKEMGNTEQANHYFEMLLKLTASSNSDRPEVKEARSSNIN
jgi:hypothetical protein